MYSSHLRAGHRSAVARRHRRRLSTAVFEALEGRRLLDATGEPDPILPDAYEPNNSFAAATQLGTTSTASLDELTLHAVYTSVDKDFFRFTAPSSGTVGIAIYFYHNEGDVRLTGYDAQQQQIAFSNSSSTANNSESFSLNVTAGQDYFIRVDGAASPDYSLRLQPLAVTFDWTMPKRFGSQFDQWGLPIIPNTRAYARPNPIWINNVEYPTYGVRLDGTGTFLGSSSVTYNWRISNHLLTRNLTGGPSLVTDLPQGQYTVTLNASAPNGVSLSTSKTINVVDRLIVAMGDSYSSGEGNPHKEQTFDWLGFTTSGAKWAQGLDGAATAAHRRAHRSSWAGAVKAAVDLENADPKSSVTFVFLSHTGATIPVGILGPQATGDPNEPGSDPSQVDQMLSIVGDRRVDALLLSIGGNDAGFAEIGSRLVEADPDQSFNYAGILNQIWADATAYRTELVNTRYPQLRNRLQTLNIGEVFLTEYPDATRDSTGGTAQQILHDIADGYEIDRNELNQVREKVMIPLLKSMAGFARASGWQYVADIASAFQYHGYGDWFRTATDSALLQGPIFNRYTISWEEKANTTGTLHPTADGHTVYRNRINASFNQPNLMTTSFSVSPSAFAVGATDGYSLTVKNFSLLGWAPASVARIFISPDSIVNTSDTAVLDVNVPALAPGQSITVSGAFPHISDPYRTEANLVYVAPVLDIHNQVAESHENDNVPVGINDVATAKSERDMRFDGFNWLSAGPTINLSGTYLAGLGTDELIGAYDIDIFAVNVAAGQRYAFDIDAVSASGLDTYIRIYSMGGDFIGTLMASNDDGRAPGEPTANNGESYLVYTFPTSGQYALVVSHAVNANVYPVTLAGRAAGAEGDYTITINSVPANPVTVTSSQFLVNARPQQLTFAFSDDVGASLSIADLQLRNTTTQQNIPTDKLALSYNAATRTATFTFPGFAFGALPDGNYRATLPAGSIADPWGNPLAADVIFDFTFLNGDANRDGRVNLQDFNILAANFGAANRTFSQGDFNYDGLVNLQDFNILASRFGTSMSPDATPAGFPAPSLFASRAIGEDALETLLN